MMQKIKQLGEQLLGIWKQLGLNQRVIVAAAGVGVFGALMGIAYWSGQSEYSLLYGNLSLKEADNIQSQLESLVMCRLHSRIKVKWAVGA